MPRKSRFHLSVRPKLHNYQCIRRCPSAQRRLIAFSTFWPALPAHMDITTKRGGTSKPVSIVQYRRGKRGNNPSTSTLSLMSCTACCALVVFAQIFTGNLSARERVEGFTWLADTTPQPCLQTPPLWTNTRDGKQQSTGPIGIVIELLRAAILVQVPVQLLPARKSETRLQSCLEHAASEFAVIWLCLGCSMSSLLCKRISASRG